MKNVIVKESFIWNRGCSCIPGGIVVEAGAPVSWSIKNSCYYVDPQYFQDQVVAHDAMYYGCRVEPENVTIVR